MENHEGSQSMMPAFERAHVDFLKAEITTGIALACAARAELDDNREYAAKLLSKAKRAYEQASRGIVEMHSSIAEAASLTQNLKALRALLDEAGESMKSRGRLRFGFRPALR